MIIVDAMGGDKGVAVTVKGAVAAIPFLSEDSKICLVGKSDAIRAVLAKHRTEKLSKITVLHADEEISMSEKPAQAIKQKQNSSLVVGLKKAAENENSAFVSAGSTGAVMAGSLLYMGRIKGIQRPAIAAFIPLSQDEKPVLLLDMGANAECKPMHLAQFGLMGSIYAKYVLNETNPLVALMNIGEEPEKGSSTYVEAYKILKDMPINFKGNIEGRDIFKGGADVVVQDGFVGNIVLKVLEGMGNFFSSSLKRYAMKNLRRKMGAYLFKDALKDLKRDTDYEEYGGAPLIGINGNVIICHGSSSSKAVKNAIIIAEKTIIAEFNQHMQIEFQKWMEKKNGK